MSTTEALLLVEDDDELRALFSRRLTRRGYHVVAVGMAAEALQALDHHAVRVAVVDRTLPDGDGLELLESLGARVAHLRCVVLSGLSADHDSTSPWLYAYLVKPCRLDLLEATVAAAWSDNGSGS